MKKYFKPIIHIIAVELSKEIAFDVSSMPGGDNDTNIDFN